MDSKISAKVKRFEVIVIIGYDQEAK